MGAADSVGATGTTGVDPLERVIGLECRKAMLAKKEQGRHWWLEDLDVPHSSASVA